MTRGLPRREVLPLLLAPAWAHGAPSARLRVAGARDANDQRHLFTQTLAVLALQAAGLSVQLEQVTDLSQNRIALELAAGRLDLGTLSSAGGSPPPGVEVLRVPLRRGLLGLRLMLARRDQALEVSKVNSIDALRKRFSFGYGQDWRDLERFRGLGFRMVTSNNYSSLFQMLSTSRFDLLHRGVNEIWPEVDNPKLVGPDIVVVPGLALFYPLDDYFCLSRQAASTWLAPLRQGLQTLMRDGRYAKLFKAHFGPALARADMAQRRVLHVVGYGVDPGTPLESFDVMELQGTTGRLQLPS